MRENVNSDQLEIKTQRRNDIDTLRVLATILLIYFHTAMIFNIWNVFHIQNNDLSLEAALFITLLLCVLVKTNNITRFIFGMKIIRKKQPQQ